MPYYNGGAIRYGFSSIDLNVHIEIIHCEFKRNKAIHHGGAIFIQTSKTVLIEHCRFESNVANKDRNVSILLYENYYDKKDKGFGGAIFLNPSFNFDGQDYCMSRVTISNCSFKNNQAYQGFDIYLEGDYCGTPFIINDNEFVNNYENENLIKGRGIIASEIFEIDKDEIENSNDFSKSENGANIEYFIYVDHSGNRIPDPTPDSTESPTPSVEPTISFPDHICNITKINNQYSVALDCLINNGSVMFYFEFTDPQALIKEGLYSKMIFKNCMIDLIEYDTRVIIHSSNALYYLSYFLRNISYNKESNSIIFNTRSSYLIPTVELFETDIYCNELCETYTELSTDSFLPDTPANSFDTTDESLKDDQESSDEETSTNDQTSLDEESSVTDQTSLDEESSVTDQTSLDEESSVTDQTSLDEESSVTDQTSLISESFGNDHTLSNENSSENDEISSIESPLSKETINEYSLSLIDSFSSNYQLSLIYESAGVDHSSSKGTYIYSLSERYTNNNQLLVNDKSTKSNKTIGIVCGVIAAVVVIVCAIFIVIVLTRKKNTNKKDIENASTLPEIVVDNFKDNKSDESNSDEIDLDFWL